MTKRRTKKQKANVKRKFTLEWDPGIYEAHNAKTVKWKKNSDSVETTRKSKVTKNTNSSAEGIQLRMTKLDIMRSVLIALGILFIELMIYSFY